jgi:hypothetical protein
MAIANYQRPTKLTFYPSYLQYAYMTGMIESYIQTTDGTATEEEISSLLVVEPSRTKILRLLEYETERSISIGYKIPSRLNVDFAMFLNHKNATTQARITPKTFTDTTDVETNQGSDFGTATSNVNYVTTGPPQYDGWSSLSISNTTENIIGFQIEKITSGAESIPLGSFVVGKKWEAPQNVELRSSIEYKYGNKQTKTVGGKTLSTSNYYKTEDWDNVAAWQFNDPLVGDTYKEKRNGIRIWDVSWDFILDKYVTPQNSMSNSILWSKDDDNEYSYDTNADSTYNSSFGIDFHSAVIKHTLGSHLPIVVNISESNNPDQWAVVRIKDYKIRFRNTKFASVKLKLEEQV